MRSKKTVTQEVIAANRRNSKNSTGPKDTSAVRDNARKHGVLAKHLKFESAEAEADFEELRADLAHEYQPLGATERILIEETCVCLWKLGVLDGRAMQELENRRSSALEIGRSVAQNYRDQQVPLFPKPTARSPPPGWDGMGLSRVDRSDRISQVRGGTSGRARGSKKQKRPSGD